MALLPGGPAGQAYAPTALSHLMTDAASPVADLYQSCSTCEALRQAESRATLALVEVRPEPPGAPGRRHRAPCTTARFWAEDQPLGHLRIRHTGTLQWAQATLIKVWSGGSRLMLT